MFSSLQLWFQSGQGLPLLVIFRRFANEEFETFRRHSKDLKKGLDVSLFMPQDCIQSLFERFLQAFERFGCCCKPSVVQAFKPSSLLVSSFGQVALTRTGKIFVMCMLCGLVDVVMKHTSWHGA